MSFKILYVEDDIDYSEEVENAVKASEANSLIRKLEIKPLSDPDNVYSELNNRYDLVIADIYFPNKFGAGEESRLEHIIQSVLKWSKDNDVDSIPVIAYSRYGKANWDHCFEMEARYGLYEIWDKNTAEPQYVAWRLGRIAADRARERPDSLMTQLILDMKHGARWHEHVVEMAKQYRGSWNENDQIQRVLTGIGEIGFSIGGNYKCKNLWEIVQRWEFHGRALFKQTRGHARHVINVFWVGYYLIHHPDLRDIFEALWREVVRSRIPTIINDNPMEGLCDAWFYASIFHDVGGCLEKFGEVTNRTSLLLREFDILLDTYSKDKEASSKSKGKLQNIIFHSEILSEAENIFRELGGNAEKFLLPMWKSSVASCKPDHGVVSALQLLRVIGNDSNGYEFAKEAARAMCVHNLIGSNACETNKIICWKDDPIAALLVVCDQLQAWDRDRGTLALDDRDEPDRAELAGLEIFLSEQKPCVTINIDYLGARHISQHPIFTRVAKRLIGVLQDIPIPALLRIDSWPFSLRPRFWLVGKKLNVDHDFNSSKQVP